MNYILEVYYKYNILKESTCIACVINSEKNMYHLLFPLNKQKLIVI